MKRVLLAISMAVPCVGLLGIPDARAQDLDPEEMVEGLGGFLKKKNDDGAISLMEFMAHQFSMIPEDQHKAMVKAVAKALGRKRREGDNRLYLASLETLSAMGELGEKAQIKSLKNNNVKKRRAVLAAALQGIGQHKNPKSIGTLTDYLINGDGLIVGAAAEALGNYSGEPLKARKKIVQELVKNFASIRSVADSRPKEPVFLDKLNLVRRPMLESLEKLTGLAQADAIAWQRWYNKNKSKRWEEPKRAD